VRSEVKPQAWFGTSGSKPRCDFHTNIDWVIYIKEVSERERNDFPISDGVARFTHPSTSIAAYPNER
jgi:hypothetical protein